jgi:hypothetical protein
LGCCLLHKQPSNTLEMMTLRKRMSRLTRVFAAAGIIAGLLAFAAPAASASSGSGFIRLAHLSPNTPPVDVYLYSFNNPHAKIVLKHVAYGTVSPYERVPAGEYTVAMRGAGAKPSSKPVLSATLTVQRGKAYTVAGMGPYKGLRLQVLPDRLTTPKGKALVRVIQASLAQPQVTVTADGHALAHKLAFAKLTGYRQVKPGDWPVRAKGGNEATTNSVKLIAGTIYTLVVLDDPHHLAIDALTDASGAKVDPNGAPQTGFGGTAARPGAPVLPWLLTGTLGLLVAAGGSTWLMRRPRRAAPHAR